MLSTPWSQRRRREGENWPYLTPPWQALTVCLRNCWPSPCTKTRERNEGLCKLPSLEPSPQDVDSNFLAFFISNKGLFANFHHMSPVIFRSNLKNGPWSSYLLYSPSILTMFLGSGKLLPMFRNNYRKCFPLYLVCLLLSTATSTAIVQQSSCALI